MKKYLQLFVFCLFTGSSFVLTAQGQRTLAIQYVKPYEYVDSDNNLMAKAYLTGENSNSYKTIVFESGRTLKVEQKDGKAWVWLPVIGEPEMIEITARNSKLNQEQLFTPLVTSDWGYFKEGTFHIISSSHQDIAWMDTPEYCMHERVNEIIAPALDIMKSDKDYYFGMEQALNLKEFVEAHPERKNEVIERYKEGRFTWGATYNQPYEGMQMGEQLIREMYFGKLWIKENFDGVEEETAFNTDVPGRTLQFPQILAKSGVDNLFVSRMREGFYDWHSPDGSSVLTYTPGNYGWAAMFYKLFEEDAIEALHKIQNRVKMWSDYYKKHNLPPHFAIVLSNDASGPVDYGHVVKEWNEIVAKTGTNIPTLRHSTVTSFLSEIKQPGAKFENLEGDRPNIWAYIHGPGHHKAITASRKAGRILPSAEIFGTVDALLNKSFDQYPTQRLSKAFEESIYPDHGWGGKNGHITDSIFKAKLEFAADEADVLLQASLNSIAEKIKTKKSNGIVVYNDLSWKRSGLASAKINNATSYYLVDDKGNVVPSQTSTGNKDEIQFYAAEIPSLGYKTFYLRKGKKNPKVNKSVAPNSLTNDYYTMHLGKGGISYLFDHKLGSEILNTTRFSGGDILAMGYNGNGAGEFTQMTEPNMEDYDKMSNHSGNWEIVADGAVYTEYENKAKFKHVSTVAQRIRVFHQEKKIDFFIDFLNWDGTHNREFRFAVPLNMEDSKIKYEVPLAIAEVGKTEMKNAPGGWAWGGTYDQKPVTIHPREVMNFIAAENEDFTVTMATDVALADWIDPTREAVDYTVLQGILMASHKSCHGEGNWYHQTGDHHFKFSLASHKKDESTSFQFGTASNHPLRTVLKPKSNTNGDLAQEMSFFTVSDPMVRISTIKKSEKNNDVILRLVEMEGKDKEPTIELAVPFKQLVKTNLIEEEESKLPSTGKEFKVNIGHNAIDTYKLIFSE
ncbi:glycoside hydrolase family 38 N-terminal domain-containing protein [Arenibacter troitsensis]|uniref:Alpha-mannosidase n=1 Tax=Arenibacter troitsensis TaxID=188872 RepID=A0A1X7KJQ1_9FLAO|nr:glycosyl hydrolase-related protein [Arenibacter troitsensis]SMG41193.1 alpha-mannosidase [Arenibacter troitsensis]